MKATKSEVRALAARKGYTLGPARRGIATEWIVELWRQYEGREVFAHDARDAQLGRAYGDLAVWLRVRPDIGRCAT